MKQTCRLKYVLISNNANELDNATRLLAKDTFDKEGEQYKIFKGECSIGLLHLRTYPDLTANVRMLLFDAYKRRGYEREVLVGSVEHLRQNGTQRVIYEVENGSRINVSQALSVGMELVKSFSNYYLFRMDLCKA